MDVLPRPMTPDQVRNGEFRCWSAATHSDRLNNHCLADKCMAWRWVDMMRSQGTGKAKIGAGAAEPEPPEKTHGICGHIRD